MEVVETIEAELNQAVREKNEPVVLTLRGIKAVLQNAAIAKRPAELTSDDVLKVLRSEVKKRRDAAGLYTQGGRAELAEKELAEIAIIEKYVPANVSDDVVRQAVKAAISASGATGPKDMGKVMGVAMASLKGQPVDGSVVSRMVKEELSAQPSA